MHISKSLEWMRPYIEDARKLVPEIRLLKSVVARRPKPTHKEVQRIHAIIHAHRNGTFSIGLMLTRKSLKSINPVKFKISNQTKIDMLDHLAHELAHLRYWDHSPHRKILEAKLSILFMKRLSKSGYISEEVEFNRTLGPYDVIDT